MVISDWFSDKLFEQRRSVRIYRAVHHSLSHSPVHCVQHFDCHQHGQSHGHRMGVAEDLAVNALELVATAQAGQMVGQLPVGQFGSLIREQEPPGGGTDGGSADIESNSHVTKSSIEAKLIPIKGCVLFE